MSLLQAAKQALEALLDAQDTALTDMCYHDEITALRQAIAQAEQQDDWPAYIPYTEEELTEATKLLDKATTLGERFAFIWETIYDHGNGKHLGALSRAQRDVANKYLQQIDMHIGALDTQLMRQAEQQEPVIDLSKLQHEDNCRYWSDEEFCTCGADSYELLKLYRSKCTAPPQREIEEAVKAEREACAQVCDEEMDDWDYQSVVNVALNNCAAAIRARGEK